MNDHMNQESDSGPYIWLRYATQYTRDGQTHTIEMSVPVPVGASAETRERLIREAEAGMSQLANHVERRGTQQLQRAGMPMTQGTQGIQGTQGMQRPAPQPASNTKPTPVQRQTVRPAAVSAPQTSSQGMRDNEPEREGGGRGPDTMRLNNASGMPAVPRTPPRQGEAGNNMLLPQFIQYIKENLDLTPKQAMELLNVRSLSTGINLRDAVEQLKQLVAQDTPGIHNAAQRRQDSGGTVVRESAFDDNESEPVRNTGSLPRLNRNPNPVIEIRPARPAGFDEEIGPDDLEETDENFDDLEDLEMPHQLSPQVLEKAQAKLSELRESQGATTASASRLQVLNNVAVSQVTEEQLQELVEGVWSIQSLKKLKVDQAEALISWAKLEDDFAEQVEAVLTLLEEEHYARGNR